MGFPPVTLVQIARLLITLCDVHYQIFMLQNLMVVLSQKEKVARRSVYVLKINSHIFRVSGNLLKDYGHKEGRPWSYLLIPYVVNEMIDCMYLFFLSCIIF